MSVILADIASLFVLLKHDITCGKTLNVKGDCLGKPFSMRPSDVEKCKRYTPEEYEKIAQEAAEKHAKRIEAFFNKPENKGITKERIKEQIRSDKEQLRRLKKEKYPDHVLIKKLEAQIAVSEKVAKKTKSVRNKSKKKFVINSGSIFGKHDALFKPFNEKTVRVARTSELIDRLEDLAHGKETNIGLHNPDNSESTELADSKINSQGSGLGVYEEQRLIEDELRRREQFRRNFAKRFGIGKDGTISMDNIKKIFEAYNESENRAKVFNMIFDIAKRLRPNAKFKFVLGDESVGGTYGEWGSIRFSMDMFSRISGDERGHIIAHELIHSVTSNIIKRYSGLGGLIRFNGKDAKAVRALKKVFEAVRNAGYTPESMYGSTNVHETVAELSDADFYNILKDITIDGRTGWQAVKDLFLDAVGLSGGSKIEINALDATLGALESIVKDYDYNAHYDVKNSISSVIKRCLEFIQEKFNIGGRFADFANDIIKNKALGIDKEVRDVDGNVMAVKKDDGTVEFNICTWGEEKDEIRRVLIDANMSEAEADAMIAHADAIVAMLGDLQQKHGLFGEFSQRKATGRPILRDTGEYISWDYSFNCVKKDAMNAVMDMLVAEGKAGNLGQTQVEAIKKILQKHGFLTPCVMCYVEAKRKVLKQGKEAETRWNSMIDALGLGDAMMGESVELSAEQTKMLQELALGKGLERVEGYSSASGYGISADTIKKQAVLLLENPTLRGKMDYRWMVSPSAFTEMYDKFASTGLMKFLSLGQYKGKGLLEATPFSLSSIPSDVFYEMFNPVKLGQIGGLRQFSYEDARAVLFFDYYTQFLLMQGARAPEHLYTKRPFMPEMFGRTGAMMNQSLIVDVWKGSEEHRKSLGLNEKEYDQWLRENAGFIPDENGELVPMWSVESFPVDTAMKNAKNPDFKGCVGNVFVAPSRKAAIWALDNKDIHMVLMYHAQGASVIMKNTTGYDKAEPFDDGYHTHDKSGKSIVNWSDAKSGVEIRDKVLMWDKLVRRYGDARKAAEVYKQVCKENGFTPMFNYEGIVDHPNYYKLLTNFRMYDEAGKSIKQGPVRAELPENWHDILDKYLTEEGVNADKISSITPDSDVMQEIRQATRYTSMETQEREGTLKVMCDIYGKDNVKVLDAAEFDRALEESVGKEKMEMLRNSNGMVYGFAVGDKIVLNDSVFNANTPMHEHTHIWMRVLKANNPRLYQRGMELWRDSKLWNDAKRGLERLGEDPTDDRIFSECISQFTGAENEAVIGKITGITDKGWMSKALSWLKEMWGDVKSSFTRWTGKDLDKLTAEEFGRMPMKAIYDVAERAKYIDALAKMKAVEAKMEASAELMFIGDEGAANLDREYDTRVFSDLLAEAERMEKKGAHKDDIWRKTGWERGKDGKWRTEIPDLKIKGGSVKLTRARKLEDIFEGDELFDAHPQLRDIKIKKMSLTEFMETDADAMYDHEEGVIKVMLGDDKVLGDAQLVNVLHEVQHAIQYKEGFAVGSSDRRVRMNSNAITKQIKAQVNELHEKIQEKLDAESTRIADEKGWSRYMRKAHRNELYAEARKNLIENDPEYDILHDKFKDVYGRYAALRHEAGDFMYGNIKYYDPEKLFEVYQIHAGEVEARNVQLRHGMTDAERAEYAPSITEDYARDEQVVMYDDGVSWSHLGPRDKKMVIDNSLKDSIEVTSEHRNGGGGTDVVSSPKNERIYEEKDWTTTVGGKAFARSNAGATIRRAAEILEEMRGRLRTKGGKSWSKESALEAIERASKEKGTYIEPSVFESYEQFDKRGESEVYRAGNMVIKVNNFLALDSVFRVNEFIDRLTAHNEFAKDVPYNILGFTRNSEGEISIVLEQPFVEGVHPTKREIEADLLEKGFKKETLVSDEDGTTEGWGNDKFTLWDAKPDNVIKDKEGNFQYIDTFIQHRNIPNHDNPNRFRIADGQPNSAEGKADSKGVVKSAAQEAITSLGGKGYVHEGYDSLNARGRAALAENPNAVGWYDEKTGEVHIYLPNCKSRYEAERTVLHEKVGHEGLRAVMGEDGYKEFCYQVWKDMPDELRGEVTNLMARKSWNMADAMDEWLGMIKNYEDVRIISLTDTILTLNIKPIVA